MGEARDILTKRVLALGRAHEVLLRTDWKGATLRDIVKAELAPFGDRISLNGPGITVHGAMVQTFALVLHELATNAAKHGALSDGAGTVSVAWSVENGRIRFCWKEHGGPPVKRATHKGFGTSCSRA